MDFRWCFLKLLRRRRINQWRARTPSCFQSLPLIDAVIQTVRFTVNHRFKGCWDRRSRITFELHLKLLAMEKSLM
ncbi:hypothetical protein ACJRO7_000706 [Eucalyptus globulus]|uniref:Uncharacterized protein n=1 Tax=Eucalyptus globulus TaxID=34317 RepID=A0ABD3LNN3_EUCGL